MSRKNKINNRLPALRFDFVRCFSIVSDHSPLFVQISLFQDPDLLNYLRQKERPDFDYAERLLLYSVLKAQDLFLHQHGYCLLRAPF